MSSEHLRVPTASNGLDRDQFRHACARFTTGVAIVSICDESGQPHGMTVNSFTSVSLDPVLFLVCIDRRASIRHLFVTGSAIAVNILNEDQRSLSSRFARPGEDRFGMLDWTPGVTGAPLLPETLATLEGIVEEMVVAGDHTILITRAHAVSYRDGRPLVYFHSRYHQLGESG